MVLTCLALAVLAACGRATPPSPSPSPSPSPAPSHTPLGSTAFPTSCDAGTGLGGNGIGQPLTCQTLGTTLTPLEFFSIVTFTEGIADSGLASGANVDHLQRENTGNPPSNTVGTTWYVTQPGHVSTGIRFYYAGFDASHETCSYLKASLWQVSNQNRLASTIVSVAANGEYTGSWGWSVTLNVGTSYETTLYDMSGGAYDAGGGGPVCCGGAGTCSQTSYSYMGATSGTTSVTYATLSGTASSAGQLLMGGPWMAWGAPLLDAGSTSPSVFGQVGSAFGDYVPDSRNSFVYPIEPVLQ